MNNLQANHSFVFYGSRQIREKCFSAPVSLSPLIFLQYFRINAEPLSKKQKGWSGVVTEPASERYVEDIMNNQQFLTWQKLLIVFLSDLSWQVLALRNASPSVFY